MPRSAQLNRINLRLAQPLSSRNLHGSLKTRGTQPLEAAMPAPTHHITHLPRRCPSCTAELSFGVRYCRECGQQIVSATLPDLEATTRRLVVPAVARASLTQPLAPARRGFNLKRSPLAASLAANFVLLLALIASSSPPGVPTSDATASLVASLVTPAAPALMVDTDVSLDPATAEAEITPSSCAYTAPTPSTPSPTFVAPERSQRRRLAALTLTTRTRTRAQPAYVRTRESAPVAEVIAQQMDERLLEADLRRMQRRLERTLIEASPATDAAATKVNAAITEVHKRVNWQRARLTDSRRKMIVLPAPTACAGALATPDAPAAEPPITSFADLAM